MTSPLRLLFASAELTPVARVGGLAEAAGGLVAALRAAGVDVHLVLPDYGGVSLDDESVHDLGVPDWVGRARVRRGNHAMIGPVDLVHVPGMDRPHPYVDEQGEGWPDNDQRFLSFSAAIAALALEDPPDVVHLNDWHTAAAAAFLSGQVPLVLTIHTLGHQGVTAEHWLERLGPEAFRFASWGATNPMAGAIQLVDRVITVSPNYAREILTEEQGMGLHERLAALGDRLVGIRNGIDTGIWNPATDDRIAARYAPDDLTGRNECRASLLAEAGWPTDTTPIIAMVTRLVDQKGIDLALGAARFLDTMPARLAVLGSGSADLAAGLTYWADRAPGHVYFVDGYDEALAHRLFAGSDLFLMPSRFEPCGLAQMQAMAYGSIPVVTDVGGLHDTVVDADRDRSTGSGFVSTSVDDGGVVDALHRGVRAARNARRRDAIRRRGMTDDWSWTVPAARHLELYADLLDR
jgi:starch synthase